MEITVISLRTVADSAFSGSGAAISNELPTLVLELHILSLIQKSFIR